VFSSRKAQLSQIRLYKVLQFGTAHEKEIGAIKRAVYAELSRWEKVIWHKLRRDLRALIVSNVR
jgi:hypothetical protein